ncbi:MAG: hypothetical protein J6D54_02980 [Olsenella sp.]|nr:hypothetical protein [Olsenella sp.]
MSAKIDGREMPASDEEPMPDGLSSPVEVPVAGEGRSVTVRLRPDVPMQMFTCIPAVSAIGACRSLRDAGVDGASIAWPANISLDGESLVRISAHAGYEEGMFADVELTWLPEEGEILLNRAQDVSVASLDWEGLAPALSDAVRRACDEWASGLRRARVVAGPLAPLLDDYFGLLEIANQPVEVVYPNGRLAARGVLCGMDVWGRASVRTASGKVLDISPEQASIRAARR